MWHKGSQYLKKMGGIILIASVLIWALGYFPLNNEITETIDEKIEKLNEKYISDIENQAFKQELEQLNKERKTALQENSYIGKIGHFIEPVIRPLGFDWKIGVSIVTGVAAKEIVVSTMGVLYGAEFDEEGASDALKKAINEEVYPTGNHKGEKIFTPLVSISFLIFVLTYFPCIAVIAAVRKESGSWKWALFMVVYTTGLAWVLSFAIYQIGNLFI